MIQGQSLTCNGKNGVTRNLRPGWCGSGCFGAGVTGNGAGLGVSGAGVTANGAGVTGNGAGAI